MSHVFPYVLIRGNDEQSIKRIIKAMDDIEMNEICVRCDDDEIFLKDAWWKAFDILMEEAERRGMKVWIYDEAKCPSGFANGAYQQLDPQLCRESIMYRVFSVKKSIVLDIDRYIHPSERNALSYAFDKLSKKDRSNDGDELISLVAFEGESEEYNPIDLTGFISNGKLIWTKPNDSEWKVVIIYKSRKLGQLSSYMNVMEKDSVKVMIDEVYEKFYERYKDRFGKSIAGFVYDSPCFGNGEKGRVCKFGNDCDLPWGPSLEEALEEQLGTEYRNMLPLLWFDDIDETNQAKIRNAFLNTASAFVESNYLEQLNVWCNSHNVKFFGTVDESEGTGSSLGNYFKAQRYGSFAAMQCLDKRVMPKDEISSNDEFDHYALGKLSSSLAAISPSMDGRSIIKTFGGYGEDCGIELQKYICNHFMVRGNNNIMPMSFTDASYPSGISPDLYADGNNPGYYALNELGKYVDRICTKISDGKADVHVAVLYHGDGGWCGANMPIEKVCRVLMDNQIDFHIIPSEAFTDEKHYRTKISKTLSINGNEYRILLIPYMQYIDNDMATAIMHMQKNNIQAFFIDEIPDGTSDDVKPPKNIKQMKPLALEDVAKKCEKYKTITLVPADESIRAMRYIGKQDLIFLFNESSVPYTGKVVIPYKQAYRYNPYRDCYEKLPSIRNGLEISIDAHETLIIVSGRHISKQTMELKGQKHELHTFELSTCAAKDYPSFSDRKTISLENPSEIISSEFSGYIRYEKEIRYRDGSLYLEVGDANDCLEVFVNRTSLGITIEKPFRYDLTPYLKVGINNLTIDVMTTMISENGQGKPCGITGEVNLYTSSKKRKKSADK